MMETENYSVTKLEFLFDLHSRTVWENDTHLTPPHDADEQIRFYQKLNLLGRTKLLKTDANRTSIEEWIGRLQRSRQDLSCLFYFLSASPSLWSQCHNAGANETVKLEDAAGSGRTIKRCKRSIADVDSAPAGKMKSMKRVEASRTKKIVHCHQQGGN